jgi:hypothetical protein
VSDEDKVQGSMNKKREYNLLKASRRKGEYCLICVDLYLGLDPAVLDPAVALA